MTEITQGYHDFYHTDNQPFTFHNLIPTDKVQRRLSFSTLLQKRPSLMGRKLSIFSRQKKPQLKVMIPMVVEDSTQLERMDTSASTSTDGDGPLTPTTPTASLYYKQQQDVSLDDLQSALTTTTNTVPLKDYSGKGYSNFYIKLPNGNWMVRVRDGNRKIVATYEIDGSMI